MLPVGILADGTSVFMRSNGNYGAVTRRIEQYMGEALELIQPFEADIRKCEVDMGRPIGRSQCVRLRKGDRVTYARRRGPSRNGLFPFAPNRKPVVCNLITLTLSRHTEPQLWYEVVAGYIGALAPPLPWMTGGQTRESRLFWSSHALATKNSLIAGTESPDPPDWVIAR